MALTSKILKKTALTRRQGYDIYIVVTDSVTEKTYNKVFFFACSSEPTDKKLETRIAHIESNVQDQINEEADKIVHPDKTREELEELLKEKGYLESSDRLEDLKEASTFVSEFGS